MSENENEVASAYGKAKIAGYTVIRIKTRDIRRLDRLKIHQIEPKWAVIERLIDKTIAEKGEN